MDELPDNLNRSNGPHIRTLRKKAGLTQDELASKAEIALRTVVSAERSQRVQSDTLIRLRNSLAPNAPLEDFILQDESPTDRPTGRLPSSFPTNMAPSNTPATVSSLNYRPRVIPAQHLPILGREKAITEIKRKLHIDDNGEAGGTVIVHGFPGVGKSALAAELAYDKELDDTFEVILWAQLGPKPNSADLLQRWGKALGVSGDRLGDQARAADAIRDVLQDRSAILLIDDVWRPADLQTFLVGNAYTPTVVTTRERQLAYRLPFRPKLFPLPVLDPESAFDLLARYAPGATRSEKSACRDLVKTLEYLPLSIVVAGLLLGRVRDQSAEGIAREVNDLRKDSNKLLSSKVPFISEGLPDSVRLTVAGLLHLSVGLLNPEEKKRFLSLHPFGHEKKIGLKRLAGLWKLNEKECRTSMEGLVNHGLIEDVGGDYFEMHALLVAYAKHLEGTRK